MTFGTILLIILILRGGVIILTETNHTEETDEVDLELIVKLIKEKHSKAIDNSFLNTNEKTALSESEMQREEFSKFSYMAGNRNNK